MRSIQWCGAVQLRKGYPFTPTDWPLPPKGRLKEQLSNPTTSERLAKRQSLTRTKFELAKKAVKSVQNSKIV